jgi:hypothetical protein
MNQGVPEHESRARQPRTRRSRTLTFCTTAVVVFVGVVVLASPMTAAAPTLSRSSSTHKAPYAGTPLSEVITYLYGCGKYSTPVYPSFNLTTGRTVGSVSVSMTSCGKNNETGDVYFVSGLGSGRAFGSSTGDHKVTARWSLSDSISLSAQSGGPGQYASAVAYVGVFAFVYDQTNESYLNVGSKLTTYANASAPSTTNYTYHVTLSSSLFLVKGHSYVVETYVLVEVLVNLSPGSSSASASVNMGSAGKQAALTSYATP